MKLIKGKSLRTVSLLLAIMLFVVAGCSTSSGSDQGSAPAGDKVTIELWHGHTGPDGKVMAELAQSFQQSQPNIEIKIQSMPWGELFTKAQLAIRGGSGPDLVSMPIDRMIVYKDAMFKPIDDLIQGQINAADFDSNLWSKTIFDGKQYGIPLDTHPYVLYYRPDLFEKAGLQPLPKDRPITKEEFERYAEALTKSGVKGFSFSQTAHHAFWDFWNLFLQNGGKVYNDDQTASAFKSEAAAKSLEYFLSLKNDKKVALDEVLDWKTSYARFTEGAVGMLMYGSWIIPGLEEAKTPYETAMVPQFGDEYGAFANMHVFAFTRIDETKAKAALEFAKWMETADNAAKWGLGSGNVPAHLEARKAYGSNPKFAPLAKTAEMMQGKLFMHPYNKNDETAVYKYIVPSFEGVYSGTTTVEAAVNTIDQAINSLLKP